MLYTFRYVLFFSAVYAYAQTLSCDPLLPFPNGRITYRDFGGTIISQPYLTGTTAEYECLPGYILVEATTKRCIAEDDAGGEWISIVGMEPICQG